MTISDLIIVALQLMPPTPVVPPTPPVPVSLEVPPQVIGALAAGAVAMLGALAAGSVKVITALKDLRVINANLAQTKAASDRIAATVGATHTAVAAATAHIETIEQNTNGRITVVEQAHQLLADKLAEIAAAQLAEARAQRDALAEKLAAAEADIVRRADAAPAVPPLTRAVRESDLIR